VLPASHPVWTAPEQPLVVEGRDVELTLGVPGWLVSGTRADGVVRVVNHGSDHASEDTLSLDDPGYARHAYSTHAGPEYDGSVVDNHVALVDPGGAASHRRPLRPLGVSGRVGASRHRTHWPVDTTPEFVWPPRQPRCRPGPELITASILRGVVEVRLARVIGPSGASAGAIVAGLGPLTLRIGGYAVAGEQPPLHTASGSTAEVRRPDGLVSRVCGLRGLPVAGIAEGRDANPYGEYSATPWVASSGPAVAGKLYIAAVIFGVGVEVPVLPEVVEVRGPAASPERADVTVRWPDGAIDRLGLWDLPGSESASRP
jgi:hypothetical protein